MVTIKTIKRTCIASPAQWEGMDTNERPIYVRYRWGYLEVCAGLQFQDIDSAVFGKVIFSQQIGDKYEGHLEFIKLKQITKDSIAFPDEELY